MSDPVRLFIGERRPLTDRGYSALIGRYGAIIGVKLHLHVFRHTRAHRFLADNANDLVGLAQILRHESLSATARYTQEKARELKKAEELAAASERVSTERWA